MKSVLYSIVFVRHDYPVTPAEQKIIDLSAKAIALQDTPEFEPILRELQKAIREHLFCVRDKVADLALLIASTSDSKAAD